MIRASIFIALMMLIVKVTGQVTSSGTVLANYLESNASFDPENTLLTDLNDELSGLLEDPVDINSNDETEIGRLFFLTMFQVRSIVEYTRIKGKIISPYEISYIPGFDAELASLISPFIRLGDRPSPSGYDYHGIYRLLTNLIIKESGNNDYPGSMIKALVKMTYSSGPVSLGLTAEKDQGEKLFDENVLPDFISGYIRYNGKGLVRSLTLGDFKVRIGQGLIAWTGYSAGTSPLVETPMKGINSLLPYSSTNENNFFRGLAISARAGNYNIHAYVSDNIIDAATDQGPDGERYITHFPDDGLHNSRLSLARKDAIGEQSAGLNINRIFGRLYLGFSASGSWFSIPVLTDGSIPEYYDFNGDRNIAFSTDYVLTLEKTYIYGEYAANPGGGLAMIQGVRLIPVNRVKINFLYSNTGRGYNSFHGNLFGKETVNNFRQSFLANIFCEIAPYTSLGTGILVFNNHWYTGYSEPPSGSVRYGLSVRFEPESVLKVIAEFTYKRSPFYYMPETGIKRTGYNQFTSGRISLVLNPSESLKLTTRIQTNQLTPLKSNGFLCYQSVNYTLHSVPLRFIFRCCLFNVDDYDSRIYTWEDDLLYSPVISPFFNSGTRTYIMADYDYRSRVSLRLKYGCTWSEDNSNTEKISNELKVQIIVNL
ncbi:MAG TPA: hypothetical protein VMW76_01765 [Bacteroidales bacterium]|nr:hypothetical protein [Bacteroidales bacterium]